MTSRRPRRYHGEESKGINSDDPQRRFKLGRVSIEGRTRSVFHHIYIYILVSWTVWWDDGPVCCKGPMPYVGVVPRDMHKPSATGFHWWACNFYDIWSLLHSLVHNHVPVQTVLFCPGYSLGSWRYLKTHMQSVYLFTSQLGYDLTNTIWPIMRSLCGVAFFH